VKYKKDNFTLEEEQDLRQHFAAYFKAGQPPIIEKCMRYLLFHRPMYFGERTEWDVQEKIKTMIEENMCNNE
jgi:hypothetical protein